MNKKSSEINLFSDNVADRQIETAKAILLSAGYKVIKIETNNETNTFKKLINHFYSRLFNKYPERQRYTQMNSGKDLKIMKNFIESKLDGTISEEVAIKECADIIDTIFDHEEEFGFKYPIKDTGILSQGDLSWITQKASDILNKKREEDDIKKIDSMFESIKVDLDERSVLLDEFLKNLRSGE